MKKAVTNILLLLVAFSLGYLAARHSLPGGLFPVAESDTITVTKVKPGDPVLVEIETQIPDPLLIDTGSVEIIELLQDVDTAQILADYFRTRKYQDTLTDDTSFKAVYQATVYRNRLADFTYQHQNLRETAIYETHVHHYNQSLMVGMDAMMAPDRFNIGPSLLFHNRNQAFQVSVGLLQKEIRFGYHLTLWRPEKPP